MVDQRIPIAARETASCGARNIADLFEAQVCRTPDAVALHDDGREVSYRELNEQADRVAHYLISRGVSSETPIGILAHRSMRLVAAILGVLKAGGAYVPIDPELPAERVTAIIKDAGIRLLLVDSELKSRLSAGPPDPIILEECFAVNESVPISNGCNNPTAEQVAYIVHTSGSTGTPKGVLISHRVFMRCDMWARDVFHFTPNDRFLFKSIRAPEELFYPLFIGARLIVAPPGVERDPAVFVSYVIKHQITVIGVSPAFLNLLLSDPDLPLATSLSHVLCSGETLPNDLAGRFAKRSQAQFYNFYGLAEAPFTSIWRYRRGQAPEKIPIGRPIDAEVLLLNSDLERVRDGEVGEIYIGGPGLARGYLNSAELTSQRFRPHPRVPGRRLYLTGDLAYYDPAHGFVLVGRSDSQIKIRGFRLEPGEVEAALRSYPAVVEAAVKLVPDSSGQMQLTAFLTCEPHAEHTVEAIRSFLALKLPDYAIPSQFRVVSKLPVTVTGKIDRAALNEALGTDLPGGTSYVAPRNQPERRLVRIWEELLGCERIGVNDNFFHLGGHSLSATQVVARIRAEFGVELPLRDFFETPTIAELGGRISKQTAKAGRLYRRHRREGPVALSFAQERLWFLDQLVPGSSAYHIPDAYLINGPVDLGVLERSARAVAQRHELLRTTLQIIDGKPAQLIAPICDLTVLSIDRSSESDAEQEAEIVRQIKENSATVFDLETGPLLQLKLVRLAPRRYLLLVNMHHVVSDDWSLGVFYRELSQFYAAFISGKNAELPPLPIQYADYALCQREWLEGGELERQLVYWREQLADAPTLELPLDFPRPPRQTFVGTRIPFQLSPELTSRLKAFNRAESVTHFMTLLAAFQIQLSRYSGQDDIVVGVPIANRRHVEVEGLFGFFVNMLVMRGDLSGQPSFREIVRQCRRTALDAYQNQDMPFEKLVENINPDRDLSRPPLFQVMFAIHDVPTHPLTIPGAVVNRRVHAVHATHFDLEFYLSTANDPWSGFIGFNTDLFASSTIERMIGHYQTLLDSLLSAPDQSFATAPMLSATEQRQLGEWTSHTADYNGPDCIHQLFEEQADRSPDAIAVQFEDQTLTYRELDLQANALANELREAGVTRETKVGVCVERSLGMVVALVATLKAGGVYVPVDIHFPSERVNLILSDAGAEALILNDSLGPLCRGFRGRIISLEKLPQNRVQDRLTIPVSGNDAAYVYYTSGSTGRPKGVIIEHRSVVNFLRAMQREPGITSSDVVLALTTISFDPAVLDIFLPLSVGARIVIVPEETRFDPEKLVELLHGSRATILQATPTTWQLLMRSKWTRKELRAFIGGEVLTPDLAREILCRCGELWNLYGPTETTVWSTVGRVDNPNDITIGRPIPNQRAYIVDRLGQLAPVGVPGELWMGGAGVGRHYVARPELTAERFVSNPFSSNPEERVYRTGDFCRYRPDGRIEYLGRIDDQIKIRGFRVEPGEIEALLTGHLAIQQCVVVDRREQSGDRRLIGYIVSADPLGPPDPASLREFLKRKLPDYMVPSAFVVLERLPLTRTGKIDRSVLPAPTPVVRVSTNGSGGPRNEIERHLVRIWEGILQMSGIRLTDDFFQIGGHSLMAVRLMSEVNLAFGVQLPLATIFRAPTVESLAAVVAAGPEVHLKPPGLIRPGEGEIGQRIFWVSSVGAVERFVECHRLARLLQGRYRFFGFDPAPDIADISALADHCVDLIRAEQPTGPYFLAGYCQCGHVAYEVATRLGRSGDDIALLAIIDSSAREFAADLRQRMYWIRDGLRGNPRRVLRRMRSAVRRKLGKRNGSNGHVVNHVDPANIRFMAHLRAVNAHRVRPFSGRIELIRSDEWLTRLPHSPKLGWDALARLVRVHPVRCKHTSVMVDSESLHVIADVMNEALEVCQARANQLA